MAALLYRRMRFFWGRETTKVLPDESDLYLRAKASPVPADTFRKLSLLAPLAVLHIWSPVRQSKVIPSVVVAVAVAMVDFIW